MPIGTLCIVDDEPRESFSELDRRRLIGLANYARSEIQTWSQARMDLKLASMDKSYRLLKTTLPRKSEKLETLFEGNTPDPSPRVPSAKPSPFLPSSKPSPRSSELSPTLPEVQTGLTPPLPNFNGDASGSASTKSEASIGGSSVDDESTISSAATSISPAHRTYSMATRLVAETLRFDLVYLVRVGTPSGPSTPLDAVKVTLIAAYGLPNTTAAQFDPNLHVKALRAPERGLLYQNPRAEELRSGEKFPAQEYASALLVPVADNKERGFVMAAYTTEPSRGAFAIFIDTSLLTLPTVFGAEDLLYMQVRQTLRQEGAELNLRIVHRERSQPLLNRRGVEVL